MVSVGGIIPEHQILEEVVPKVTKFELWLYNLFVEVFELSRLPWRDALENRKKKKQNKTKQRIWLLGRGQCNFLEIFFYTVTKYCCKCL